MNTQLHRRLWLQSAGAAATASLLSACTVNPDHDHDHQDAPRFQPLERPVRVAWVLSSGGPRGFVHIGVLKALQELGLKPDLIVGASAGALVGSLYAAGLNAGELQTLALKLNPLFLARIALFGEEPLSGAAIADWVRKHCPERLIERMPIALACVAVRQRDAQPVAFTAGDVGLAVQASAAIEGQFTPVRIRGERYVDPDWVMPLPVRLARALGARRVLAIDASTHLDNVPPDAEAFHDSDLRKQALINKDAPQANVLLKPPLGYWAGTSHAYRERVIQAGYLETLAQASVLRALHAGESTKVLGASSSTAVRQ
ncbi:MAG: patatin-like phospholipase family protein [Burkholderiaceae bacterium]|nr:patatin-like phospholipase family protein [Burkholderiaceae bacterium]